MGIKVIKTASVIKAIKENAGENHLIVLPTRRSISILASLMGTSPMPAAMTHEEFFESLLDTGVCTKADRLIKILTLQQALHSMSEKYKSIIKEADEQQIKSLTKFKAFGEYLLGFYKELLENRVSFDCLEKEALYTDYEKEIETLKELLELYKKLLSKKSMTDTNILKKELKMRELRHRIIHIAFSGILTRYEEDALLKLSETNSITLYVSSTVPPIEAAGQFLKKIEKSTLQKEKEEKQPDVEIYKTPSDIEMADWVVEMIHREQEIYGTPLEEIAVVLPDEGLVRYLRLIDRELFNFAAGFPLKESIFLRFLRLALETLDEKTEKGIPGTYIAKLRAHPFIRAKNIDGYKPIYDKKIGGVFECIEKIRNAEEISLQSAALKLLKCFKNVPYESEHYDFVSSRRKLFDELEKLSLLNREMVRIHSGGKEMLEFIYNWLAEMRYPDVGIGKVSVLGMLESRLLEKRVIIMPSVNEETLPEPSKKELFLNTRIRKSCGLPTFTEREDLQHYYFESAIAASKRAYIGYVENEEKTASRFIIEFLEKRNPLVYRANPLNTLDIRTIGSPILLREPVNGVKKDEEMAEIIEKLRLSAHSITDFKECPYRFYLRYIKGIGEERGFREETIYTTGNIVHRVMEELYKNKKPIHDAGEFRKQIEQLFRRMIKESDICLTNPQERLKLEYLLYRILHSKIPEIESACKAEQIEHEKSFRIEIEGKVVEGKIDRINLYSDGFDIIDYKTGSVAEIKKPDKPYNVQLPLYAIATKKETKKECKKVGYLSFRDMRYIYMDRIVENLGEFEEDIANTVKKIKETEFFEKNSKYCALCPYREICRT